MTHTHTHKPGPTHIALIRCLDPLDPLVLGARSTAPARRVVGKRLREVGDVLGFLRGAEAERWRSAPKRALPRESSPTHRLVPALLAERGAAPVEQRLEHGHVLAVALGREGHDGGDVGVAVVGASSWRDLARQSLLHIRGPKEPHLMSSVNTPNDHRW